MNACSSCGKETRNKKFCSRSCSARVTNSTHPKRKARVYAICRCGNVCSFHRAKYCSIQCILDGQYETYIAHWLSGEESGGSAKTGELSMYIKRWLRKTYGNKCSQCGWCEVHSVTGKVPITVDHIDGNYMNNRPENLRLLCPNCHSLTPTYGNLNNGNGRPKRRKITGL